MRIAVSVCAHTVVMALAIAVAGGPAAAHHVGVYVPRDNEVSANFKQIKFALQARKLDVALRLFHLHAEGMGLVIIATTMTAVTLVRSDGVRRAVVVLLTAGGAGYPVGYLLWGALIPYYGVESAKTIAERVIWIPFGGATIAATWWLTVLVAMRLVRRS